MSLEGSSLSLVRAADFGRKISGTRYPWETDANSCPSSHCRGTASCLHPAPPAPRPAVPRSRSCLPCRRGRGLRRLLSRVRASAGKGFLQLAACVCSPARAPVCGRWRGGRRSPSAAALQVGSARAGKAGPRSPAAAAEPEPGPGRGLRTWPGGGRGSLRSKGQAWVQEPNARMKYEAIFLN